MNLAVGFFDGVHLGHQRILAHADAALTFTNHPATVYAPDRAPRLLMTAEERLAAISALGVGRVIARDFTPALAAQTPGAFAESIRQEFPDLDTVFCGPNWTFGTGGTGTAETLRRWAKATCRQRQRCSAVPTPPPGASSLGRAQDAN